ncbi:alpha/beta fold hydrolase [Nonomuraea sp. NPDC052265]|uniref:alpha/beta fold hydrolase n=1 Tax=Nonomuraea sp. NPDC052265 TaxID=3364374 RepID=UPI0037C68381
MAQEGQHREPAVLVGDERLVRFGEPPPELAGHRSLFVDLLGFGTSDRPTAFGYTMEEHADALATALRAADVRAAQVVAHSMGGTIAVHLARQRGGVHQGGERPSRRMAIGDHEQTRYPVFGARLPRGAGRRPATCPRPG